MTTVLIADIGATNSRFGVVGANGLPDRVLTVSDEAMASAEDAVAWYLEQTGVKPSAAVLGVAAPIEGEVIELTNRDWRFRQRDLQRRFGIADVVAINDFEAVAWSLAGLRQRDLHYIGPQRAASHGPKIVFGPGTGLGVAALVTTPGCFHVIASEGGHASFGAASEQEDAVFARVRAESGLTSAEAVLSGKGLERLHRALHRHVAQLSAAEIARRALAGEHSALETIALFVRLLGRYGGDLALMFKATGGVFLAGGVAQRIGPLLDHATFRAAFEAHAPYEGLLRPIPTALITLEQPGLLGCAMFAAHALRDRSGATPTGALRSAKKGPATPAQAR